MAETALLEPETPEPDENSWQPPAAPYLEVGDAGIRPQRPVAQGDVFEDVPLPLVAKKDQQDGDVPKIKRTHVMMLGNTCSLRGGSRLATSQNVALVRPAKEGEVTRFQESWANSLFLLPLPGFIDEELWVADLRSIGTLHFREIQLEKRIACLSHEGLAAMQSRYADHSVRASLPVSQRVEDTQEVWNELELWEEWCARGHAYDDFPAWLDAPISKPEQYASTLRRELIEVFPELVLADMPEPIGEPVLAMSLQN